MKRAAPIRDPPPPPPATYERRGVPLWRYLLWVGGALIVGFGAGYFWPGGLP
jgi:hypothetical protein